MRKSRLSLISLILVLSVILMLFAGCSTKGPEGTKSEGQPAKAQAGPYSLRMFSAGESGMTYVSMSAITGIIRNHKPEIWKDVTTIPSAGPYAGFRAIQSREGEGTYSNIPQMVELWKDTGNFAKDPIPKQNKALLGPCLWEHQNVLLARADRDDLKSIWDLKGKKVCPTLPGYVTEVVSKMIHEKLDLPVQMVYVEMSAISDALKNGMIDATWGYVLSSVGVPSWMTELEMRLDAKVVPFSKEDAELIASKVEGVAAAPLSLKKFSTKLKGPETSWSPVLGTYWVFSPDLPEQAVYEIMVALYEHRKEVGEVHPAHCIWAEDALGVQERHIEVAAKAGIPIHPGFAKWLKEQKVWHDNWLVGEVNQ
ncbi:MAG: TAXI family TRAP transporter solute-binding subunit [Peptococcaceae bacterium]|nr:ABC transporter substrate-binding protein [Peptococcaceae bacterium]MDH7523909.1 TAXI family TRAP transporter solute-binding subunit [Peptococcaceae bacterium]